MDNALYRTVRASDGSEKANAKDKGERLAIALEKLIRNRDWKVVAEDLLTPRLAGAREGADKLEGAELFRYQGEIRVLKFLLNLETALTAQKQTIEHEIETEDP